MTRLVDETYVDAYDRRRPIPPEDRAAVYAAMGLEPDEEPPDDGSIVIVRPGAALPEPGEVVLEDGTSLGRVQRLPRDVPFGYHRLVGAGDAERLLVVGPGRCHLPSDLRAWGWAVQLATLRSRRSWGIGDLGDLGRLAAWSGDVGAGFLAVSPLGAPNPGPHPEPSPYYPSTRRFGNPLHLDVAAIAAESAAGGLDDLVERGERLSDAPSVDRAAVLSVKREALERIWRAGVDRVAVDAWLRTVDADAVLRWATFNVLTERFGAGWQSWPEELRDPSSEAVARVRNNDADAVAFHVWVQWCFDRQLAAASGALARIADMPVGVDPGGFDAWDWQGQLALGASVGAPPDRFNQQGQDWGLPPFVPHRLRAVGYRPFIETLRAQLRHARGLRIDHALGLFRLWWIPGGRGPDRGAYVRYPTDELLEIVAIESHRSEAVIIGEDLGTVPPGVRRELRRRRLLSTRLALFERKAPSSYPRQAFAGVTTHDLPTIVGTVTGADLDDQRAAGVDADPASLDLLRRRLVAAAGVDPDVEAEGLSVALHRRLAASPAAMVAATLEDALGVAERPNLPGTTSEQRENWSRALPEPIDQLTTDARVTRLVEALQRPD